MASMFRFLASLIAHVAWHRSGRRGVLPPMRLSRKKSSPFPVPSLWQIMAASWAAERLWKAYGPVVKQRLKDSPSPAVHKIGDLLPGPEQVAATPQKAPQRAASVKAKSSAATQLLPQPPSG